MAAPKRRGAKPAARKSAARKPTTRKPTTKKRPVKRQQPVKTVGVKLAPEEAAGIRTRLAGLQVALEAYQAAQRVQEQARVIYGMAAESRDAFVDQIRLKYGLPEDFQVTADDYANPAEVQPAVAVVPPMPEPPSA